jgi:O-antigen/teichoic acid export membrane protein
LAEKDVAKLNRAAATCLGAYLLLGAAAAVASAFFYAGFEAHTIPKIAADAVQGGLDPAAVCAGARLGYALMTLTIAAGFVSQLPYGVLVAYGDFPARNAVMIGALLLRLVATFALVKRGPSALGELGSVQLLCVAFEWVVSAAVVKRRRPEVRLGLKGFDPALLREILGFSVFVLLLNLGNKLVFQTSGLVLGWKEGVTLADVAVFEKAKSFVLPITEFVVSIGAVVMPEAVKLKTAGRVDQLRGVLLRWSKLALGVALLPGLYLAVFGTDFFRAYIDLPDFDYAAAGRVQFILLLAHFLFLPVRGVALPILTGVGNPRKATVAFVIAGVVNLGLSLALLEPFGLNGVAYAMAAPLVGFAAYLLALVCGELEMPVARWFAYVLGRPLVGAAIVALAAEGLRRSIAPQGLPGLVAVGVAYCAAFVAVWVLFVHRGDPEIDFLARLRARLAAKRSAA